MQHYFVPKPPPLPSGPNAGWPTGLTSKLSEVTELHARVKARISPACPASMQAIANGALFVAAPPSSYINGHVLPIDGGWTAGFARDY